MPNVFTRVPERPVPALPRWARAVLPAADLFMVLMYSRPPTGTLRTTWVTPGTLQLGAVLAVVGVAGGAVLLAAGLGSGRALEALLGGLLLLFGLGCAAVAAVGLAQRAAR